MLRMRTSAARLLLQQQRPHAMRAFARSLSSNNNTNNNNKSDLDFHKQASPAGFLEQHKGRLTTAAYVSTGLAVTWAFYDITYRFLSLTPALSLKYGFWGGVLSTAFISAGAYGVDSYIHTRPDTVFAHASSLVNSHQGLREALGGVVKIQPHSAAKVYATNAGYFSVLSWKTPVVELLFRATGAHNAQAVIMVRSRHNWVWHKATLDLVAADVARPGKPRSRVVLLSNTSTSKGADYNDNFNQLLKQVSDFAGHNATR